MTMLYESSIVTNHKNNMNIIKKGGRINERFYERWEFLHRRELLGVARGDKYVVGLARGRGRPRPETAVGARREASADVPSLAGVSAAARDLGEQPAIRAPNGR